jgi:hypothetical protein
MTARRWLVACAVVALGSAFTAADGLAVAQPTASPAVVVLRAVAFEPGPAPAETDQKDAPDAELIGKVVGTSTAGGADWQTDQDAMSAYSAKLEAAAGARIVGNFVPRSTSYAMVVRVSGSEPMPGLEALAARAAARTGVPVSVEYVNTPTLETMLAAAGRFGPDITRAQDGVGDIWPDEATSEVAIEVTRGVGDPALVRAQAAATFGADGIPFRIDVTDEGWRTFAQ